MMPRNVGTSSTHVDVQDTMKDFLPKEGKNKNPVACCHRRENPTA